MKFYLIQYPIIGQGLYIPFASGDKMTLADRRLFDSISTIPLEGEKTFDYFRSYGFGDEDEPNILEKWEHAIYDYYEFTFTDTNRNLISEKLRTILKDFIISPLDKFYPANFMYRNQKYNYHIFQQYHNTLDLIDFEETEFVLYDIKNDLIKDYSGIKITKDNFLNTYNDLYSNQKIEIKYKSLVFKEYFDVYGPKTDMIGHIVSERLKDAMIQHNIKGMAFRELGFNIHFTDKFDI